MRVRIRYFNPERVNVIRRLRRHRLPVDNPPVYWIPPFAFATLLCLIAAPDNNWVSLLCLVFVSSVVKSCGGTATETQDAIFESKIDMRRLRTEICNVQMMVRGWEHDEELDTAHVRLMTKLVDILLM